MQGTEPHTEDLDFSLGEHLEQWRLMTIARRRARRGRRAFISAALARTLSAQRGVSDVRVPRALLIEVAAFIAALAPNGVARRGGVQ